MALCLFAWTAKLKQWVSKKAAWSSPAVSPAHDFLMHCLHTPSSGVISTVRHVWETLKSIDFSGGWYGSRWQKRNASVCEGKVEKLGHFTLTSYLHSFLSIKRSTRAFFRCSVGLTETWDLLVDIFFLSCVAVYKYLKHLFFSNIFNILIWDYRHRPIIVPARLINKIFKI